MDQSSTLAPLLDETPSNPPDTIYPYLQQALNHTSLTGTVSLFNPSPSPPTTWPKLNPSTQNQILLYPGSFNPPHTGHLATIQHLFSLRTHLNITTLILFNDPSPTILSKRKKHSTTILPRHIRNTVFSHTPELNPLIHTGWLHLLNGTMESHIAFLRTMTDGIATAGWDVKLVGFLGGDKLSVESEPHLPPGELGAWGPLDEFLIANARRPVDFYVPGEDSRPRDLPGCTSWVREGRDVEGKSFCFF
jgi:hypothetical protein